MDPLSLSLPDYTLMVFSAKHFSYDRFIVSEGIYQAMQSAIFCPIP